MNWSGWRWQEEQKVTFRDEEKLFLSITSVSWHISRDNTAKLWLKMTLLSYQAQISALISRNRKMVNPHNVSEPPSGQRFYLFCEKHQHFLSGFAQNSVETFEVPWGRILDFDDSPWLSSGVIIRFNFKYVWHFGSWQKIPAKLKSASASFLSNGN